MLVDHGSHAIGPGNGQVTVSTYVGGIGARMGHDLVLEATRWEGSITVEDADAAVARVQVTIDAKSLEVRQATGGLKPLSDKDKADISHNQAKTLQADRFPQITYQSTAVSGDTSKLALDGNLEIAGQSRPVTLDVTVEDTGAGLTFRATTRLLQTDFGIKPYSKLGALRVKDEVDLEIVVTLPSA